MSAERSKLVRVRSDEQKYAQSQWAVCVAPRAARKIIINNTLIKEKQYQQGFIVSRKVKAGQGKER